jgi:hypothetical protein
MSRLAMTEDMPETIGVWAVRCTQACATHTSRAKSPLKSMLPGSKA